MSTKLNTLINAWIKNPALSEVMKETATQLEEYVMEINALHSPEYRSR